METITNNFRERKLARASFFYEANRAARRRGELEKSGLYRDVFWAIRDAVEALDAAYGEEGWGAQRWLEDIIQDPTWTHAAYGESQEKRREIAELAEEKAEALKEAEQEFLTRAIREANEYYTGKDGERSQASRDMEAIVRGQDQEGAAA